MAKSTDKDSGQKNLGLTPNEQDRRERIITELIRAGVSIPDIIPTASSCLKWILG